MEFPSEDEETEVESSTPMIDVRLTEIAKKMPIFEPENRVDSSALERPLIINLDLALYRAKMLARNFQYDEAQQVLQKVFLFTKILGAFFFFLLILMFRIKTLNLNKRSN